MYGRNTPDKLIVRQAEEILGSMNEQIARVSLGHAMSQGQRGLMDDLEFGRYPGQMIDWRSLATLDGIQPGLREFILDEAERRQDQASVAVGQPEITRPSVSAFVASWATWPSIVTATPTTPRESNPSLRLQSRYKNATLVGINNLNIQSAARDLAR